MRIPLRFKVALSFTILLTVLLSIVGAGLIHYESRFLENEVHKRARILAETLAANVREPLLGANLLGVVPAVESAASADDVRYALLRDHRGRVVYDSRTAPGGKNIDPTENPGGLLNTAPVVVDGIRIGEAVVALDEGSITSVVERTLDKLLLSLTGTLVLGIAGIVYLSGFHVRKLEDLLGVVRHVADGDLTARVCGFGRDEIGSLAREFNRMMAKLEEGQDRLEASFRETVSALAAAIEARDAYTGGHCERVGRICRAIGERIGLSESDLQELELAAILHDVGKIGIDEAILGKQGPLALPEKEGMRRHAEIGSHILSRLSFMERVGIYVRHHHEYYDGSGYPDGLADKDIPLASRILAVVDAFDAMTTTRAYRGALPKDEAVRRVRSARGSQFDPSVVDAFLACNAAGTIDQICADHRAAAA